MLLKLGDQSYEVSQLQYFLRQVFGFENTHLIPTDGEFTAITAKAVEIFQERVSLPITGECDRITWDKLEKVAGRSKSIR